MMRRLSIVLIVIVSATLAVSAQGWKKIGSKTIDFKNVNDTIVINKKDRVYSKFKLSVSGASVRISRLVLTFRNGEKRTFNSGFTVEKGESTSEVDISGVNAGVQRIDFRYEPRSLNAKKATIKLFAIPSK